jgi:hypothetical protein
VLNTSVANGLPDELGGILSKGHSQREVFTLSPWPTFGDQVDDETGTLDWIARLFARVSIEYSTLFGSHLFIVRDVLRSRDAIVYGKKIGSEIAW